MEEMNNLEMNQEVTEIVEAAAEKLTFGQNALAYGLATVFGVGVCTIGYGCFKGGRAIARKLRDRKERTVMADDDVEYEDDNVQDIEYDNAE